MLYCRCWNAPAFAPRDLGDYDVEEHCVSSGCQMKQFVVPKCVELLYNECDYYRFSCSLAYRARGCSRSLASKAVHCVRS
jgi:hypothetical protein